MKIALGLEYEGSGFAGWQTQPAGNSGRDHGCLGPRIHQEPERTPALDMHSINGDQNSQSRQR